MNLQIPLTSETQNLKPRQVLLIEDDPHWEMIITKTLKVIDQNASLSCVRTASQAQHLLDTTSKYDLIISDHFLAGDVTGLDLWRECQSSSHRRTPFMMLSGLRMSDFLDLVEAEDCFPLYVEKNFAMESLKSTISMQLGATKKVPAFEAIKLNVFDRQNRFVVISVAATLLFMTLTFSKHDLTNKASPPLLENENPLKTPPVDASLIVNVAETTKGTLSEKQKMVIDQIITPDLKMRIKRIVNRASALNERMERLSSTRSATESAKLVDALNDIQLTISR